MSSLTYTHSHTHTPLFNGPFSRTTQVSRYQKGKTKVDFTEARQLQLHKKLRLGTWNIRSMLQLGKVQVLGDEMMRLGVDICGGCTE